MNAADVNLYLVGFMGTGKTTVGRAAAQRLGFAYLDSDHEIERMQGKTVAEIFAGAGEPAFRAMEREFVTRGHPPARAAVACGGGLVIQPGLGAELHSRGVVVCLHASLETILERTGRQTHRPLIAGENPEGRLRALYAERESIYRSAGTLILTDGRPLKEIVGHVVRVWKREAAEFARTRS
jgi:shikimate kinase